MVVRLALPTQAWPGVLLGVGSFHRFCNAGHLVAARFGRTRWPGSGPPPPPAPAPALPSACWPALPSAAVLTSPCLRIGLSERWRAQSLPHARQHLSHALQRVRHPPSSGGRGWCSSTSTRRQARSSSAVFAGGSAPATSAVAGSASPRADTCRPSCNRRSSQSASRDARSRSARWPPMRPVG